MSEVKHTPGPWSLFEVGERPTRLCPGKKDNEGPGGESLLTIVEEDGTVFAAVQRKEDARLIAAAPDLLEAAEDALEELYRVSPSRAAPKLRAAIAKATGEQQ